MPYYLYLTKNVFKDNSKINKKSYLFRTSGPNHIA